MVFPILKISKLCQEWFFRKLVLFTLHNESDFFSITWQGKAKRTENKSLHLITYVSRLYKIKINKKEQSEKKKKQDYHESAIICT